MKFFYLSSIARSSGNFEIHEKNCVHIPEAIDRYYLGPFNNGQEALRKAMSLNAKSVCCETCCKLTRQSVFISRSKEK